MNIEKGDLENMSFADFNVLDTQIDRIAKSMIFSLSGAWMLLNEKRVELGPGNLKITGYDSISISSYNSDSEMKTILPENKFEPLKTLCEVTMNEQGFDVVGFAKNTHNWIEFSIVGGTLKGEFKDLDDTEQVDVSYKNL